MKKSLITLILIGFCFLLPLIVRAKESCNQILEKCREEAQKDFKKCLEEADSIITDISKITCEDLGYTPSTKEFQNCLNEFASDYRERCTEKYGQDFDICEGIYKTCKKIKKDEGRISIIENVASAPAFQATIPSDPECGYSGGIVKNSPGEISFRIKPTKDPCYYEIVQKDSKPSHHELRYTPSDIEHCCIFSLNVERDYYFIEKKTYINFKKNLNKPFYFEIRDQTKSSVQCYVLQQRDFAHELYESNWPLSNGYQEDLAGHFTLKLYIDEKEVERLKENCIKKKK